MRPFAIGLTAALAVAILIPATVISAPKEEKGKPAIDAKAREKGMKDAPAAVTAAGVACSISDARLVGENTKSGDKFYEVACSDNMGFAVIAKKDATAQAYNCMQVALPTSDGKKSDLTCILPGNANPITSLTPMVQKANVPCEIENARIIGAGAKSTVFELACKGGSAYLLQTSNPVSQAGEIMATPCLSFEEGSNMSCTLTDRATQLQIVDKLNATAANNCVVKDKRYMLTTKTDNYYEVACQDGKGYVYQQTLATGAYVRAIPCIQAGNVNGGCTLSDTVAAQTEAVTLYTKLSKTAGFPCDVEKYGMLPSTDPKKEIVELKCKGSDIGGIGIFTANSGVVYDCLTAEFNGFRCTFTKFNNEYARLSQDLVNFNKASCKVSEARVIGATPTEGYVEVGCSDGLPGWVLSYPVGVAKPKAKEFLSCAQAKGIGGGCKLPNNKTKS